MILQRLTVKEHYLTYKMEAQGIQIDKHSESDTTQQSLLRDKER